MHLNGENVKMSFVGKNLQEMASGLKIDDSENIWTPGSVCPHPGAIYMYITVIINDLLL